MKLLNRKEFLALPAGVIYAKYDPHIFGELSIKGDSLDHDWYHQDFIEVDARDSDELFEILEIALGSGRSFDLNFNTISRDGLYDGEQLFAVFEKEDVEGLMSRLQESLNDYPEI